MNKVVYNGFGSTDVLEIIEVEAPKIKQDEILIQVKAVSINPLDRNLFSGDSKMMSGKKFPKMVGIDFSGIVMKIGNNITDFKIDDEIFGGVRDPMKQGALAEQIVVKSNHILLKPKEVSFTQAAAMTSVGAPAIKALEEKAKLQKGQKVLINGASGGVGMMAIQIAKNAGAIVTAVSSTKGLPYMKDWGADFLVDYRKEDVKKLKEKFDVVFELSGKLSFGQAKGIMKTNASFMTLMGAGSIGGMISGLLGSLFSKRKYSALIAPATKEVLMKLSDYAKNGLKVHIGKQYSMQEIRTAYSEIEKTSSIGKAVFSIE